MDCIVHGVAKSWTWLRDFHFPLFKEELVGREPGSVLSLEDEWKDHEKKKKLLVRAEFFLLEDGKFLGESGKNIRLANPDS